MPSNLSSASHSPPEPLRPLYHLLRASLGEFIGWSFYLFSFVYVFLSISNVSPFVLPYHIFDKT